MSYNYYDGTGIPVNCKPADTVRIRPYTVHGTVLTPSDSDWVTDHWQTRAGCVLCFVSRIHGIGTLICTTRNMVLNIRSCDHHILYSRLISSKGADDEEGVGRQLRASMEARHSRVVE